MLMMFVSFLPVSSFNRCSRNFIKIVNNITELVKRFVKITVNLSDDFDVMTGEQANGILVKQGSVHPGMLKFFKVLL